MKNIRKVIYALIVLNLVVDAAFLVLAPDQVAVHFGASGEADRIGSKYEHLWFPALALAFGLGLPFIAKRSDAHDGDKLLKADVVLLALMAVFSLFVFAALQQRLAVRSTRPQRGKRRRPRRGHRLRHLRQHHAEIRSKRSLRPSHALEPEQRRGVAQIAAFRRVRDDRLGRADRRSRARTAHELGHARHGGHPLGGSRREHRRLVRVLPKALRLR